MLRPCLCMRPSPSFIPPVCSQRLWANHGPVNILQRARRLSRSLNFSFFLFSQPHSPCRQPSNKKKGLSEKVSESCAGVRRERQTGPKCQSMSEPSHLGYLPAAAVRPSVRHIPAGGRPLSLLGNDAARARVCFSEQRRSHEGLVALVMFQRRRFSQQFPGWR